MIKASTVAGKGILSRDGGERLGTVHDLVLSKDHTRIIALVVDRGGLFGHAKVIPMDKVVSLGKDVVLVTNSGVVVEADQVPEIHESLDNKEKLIGKKVFTDQGEEQARVSDVFFDEDSGRITGYELTVGAVRNVAPRTTYLPVEEVVSIGPDAMIVSSEGMARLSEPGEAASAVGPVETPVPTPTPTPTPAPAPMPGSEAETPITPPVDNSES